MNHENTKERNHEEGQKYRDLWAAVVERAAMDLTDRSECNRASAYAWFTSEREDPYTFLWVCDALELAPDQVRKRVLAGIRPPRRVFQIPVGPFFEWRERHGLTMQQLADRLGCSPSAISQIEKGLFKGGRAFREYMALVRGSLCNTSDDPQMAGGAG